MNGHYMIRATLNRCIILFLGAIVGLFLGMAIVSKSVQVDRDISYSIITIEGMPCLVYADSVETCDWSRWHAPEPTPRALLVKESPPTLEPTPRP